MSRQVGTVPIVVVEHERSHPQIQKADAHRLGRGIPAAMIALLSALLLAACSSKNPDSLTGMNVDENLAIMDANATSDTNVTAGSISDTGATLSNGAAGDAAANTGTQRTSQAIAPVTADAATNEAIARADAALEAAHNEASTSDADRSSSENYDVNNGTDE